VSAWFAYHDKTCGRGDSRHYAWGAVIRNASDLPVFDVRVFFYYVAERWEHGDWDPTLRGSPLGRIRVAGRPIYGNPRRRSEDDQRGQRQDPRCGH
jgi:hypothetical protein